MLLTCILNFFEFCFQVLFYYYYLMLTCTDQYGIKNYLQYFVQRSFQVLDYLFYMSILDVYFLQVRSSFLFSPSNYENRTCKYHLSYRSKLFWASGRLMRKFQLGFLAKFLYWLN